MNTFRAVLVVDNYEYALQDLLFGAHQMPRSTGGVSGAPVVSGDVTFKLVAPADDVLEYWGYSENVVKDVSVVLYESETEGVYKTYLFKQAQCVTLQNHFSGNGVAGSYTVSLQITCDEILSNGKTLYKASWS